MLTVVGDAESVEVQLVSGALACPCAGSLRPWGWARPRSVPLAGERVAPRRGRCRACEATHVLLPAAWLWRRWDPAAVIGGVLAAVADGGSVRGVAAATGRPRGTVRGWVARFRAGAELLRAHFTAWAAWLGVAVERLDPTGSPLRDAVAALAAAAGAGREALGVADVWEFASAATGGRLLCNTRSPFPAPWTG